ncbi:hypothetical protein AAE169_004912, partial [Escherichia coli]
MYLNGTTAGNVNLTAVNGTININGTSYGLSLSGTNASLGAGVSVRGNISLSAKDISLNATNAHTEEPNNISSRSVGLLIYGNTNISFEGNSSINANSTMGAGIFFHTSASSNDTSTLKFSNGTASINASNNISVYSTSYFSAISMGSWGGRSGIHANAIFDLQNSNLTITATAPYSSGIGGYQYNTPEKTSSLTFNGTGNVNITGSGMWGGVVGLKVNNTGLNGTTTITGSAFSTIAPPDAGDNPPLGVHLIGSSLVNTTITGNASGNGTGVGISGNSSLTNTTVSGA